MLLGYALILWPLGRQTFGAAVVQSGSSLFTLGLSSPGGRSQRGRFAAAATGLGIVALRSPTCRRCTLHTAAERRWSRCWRAGQVRRPGESSCWRGTNWWASWTGFRHFYDEWERWAADVAESHTTYPVLAYFRSARPLDSWITGELAVLDSAALYLAVSPSRAPSESRLCLRMGFTCLRDIADALGIGYDPDPRRR